MQDEFHDGDVVVRMGVDVDVGRYPNLKTATWGRVECTKTTKLLGAN